MHVHRERNYPGARPAARDRAHAAQVRPPVFETLTAHAIFYWLCWGAPLGFVKSDLGCGKIKSNRTSYTYKTSGMHMRTRIAHVLIRDLMMLFDPQIV